MIYSIRRNNKSIDDIIYEFTRDCMYDNIYILEKQYNDIININESGIKEKFITILTNAYEAIKAVFKKIKDFITGIFSKQKSKKIKEKIKNGSSKSSSKKNDSKSATPKNEPKSNKQSSDDSSEPENKSSSDEKPSGPKLLTMQPFSYWTYNNSLVFTYMKNIFSGSWEKSDTVESITKSFKEKFNMDGNGSAYLKKAEAKSADEKWLLEFIDTLDSGLEEDRNAINKFEKEIDAWQKERINELYDLYDKNEEMDAIERFTNIYTKKYNAVRICIQEYASFIARAYNTNLNLVDSYYSKYYG